MLQKRMKELRLDRGLTQNEPATVLRISREAYSMYENGKRQLSCQSLVQLAQFYGVTTDYLLGLSDDPDGAPKLTGDEQKLLEHFRSCDQRGKRTVLQLAAQQNKESNE
jgi:transcriptional regulator with XRE-family HTH domain